MSSAILVIDDEAERLAQLTAALRRVTGAEVLEWLPERDEDPVSAFAERAVGGVGLVATDQDLTKDGPRGLVGSSIAAWCLERYLPVVNFSRRPDLRLPRERSFFELSIARELTETQRASEIHRLADGFDQVRASLGPDGSGLTLPGQMADAVGAPELANDFAPYFSGMSLANGQFLQDLHDDSGDRAFDQARRGHVRAFLLGHVLANAVLEFPGPILGVDHLAAYCATSSDEAARLEGFFAPARYDGPFSASRSYFLRHRVDEMLQDLADGLPETPDDLDDGDFNRLVLESALGPLAAHGCLRHDCDGVRGGLWCPFVRRAVCTRDDCSTLTSSWIPRGATLCRVEKEFFDENASLLGI